MSSVTKSTGRKTIELHDNLDVQSLYTPVYQSDDPYQVPFQEFIDSDINNEKWYTELKVSSVDLDAFNDTVTTLLPPSLEGYQWMSVKDIFPNAQLVVKLDDPQQNYPDLISANQHLFVSEFMRSFISSIDTLFYLSYTKNITVEYVSNNFSPSFEKDRWRPWHHIYSHCKSGKSYPHAPVCNKTGKYIVRLFWMGSWKKIYISDKMPLDANNKLLVPQNHNQALVSFDAQSNTKKEVIEIWPFLLAKALMIIASITWTKENELVDFDIIQCLTGWIANKINISRCNPLDVWKICMDHTSQYVWNSDEEEVFTTRQRAETNKSIKQSISKKSMRSDSRLNVHKKTFMQLIKCSDDVWSKHKYVVVMTINVENGNLKVSNLLSNKFVDKQQHDIKNWCHEFLVVQTRTVPILKPTTDEEFEAWKRYRWIDWAIEHGLINPRKPPHPIRSFKTVDPFRFKYSEVESISLREETSINSDSNRKKKHNQSITDITSWLNLEAIERNLKYVTIYYLPSSYKAKAKISNISCENITKEPKYPFVKSLVDLFSPNWKEIIRPIGVQKHRNEPLYIFCDNLHEQSIIINLNQTGHLKTIFERVVKEEQLYTETVSECGLCVSTFLDRVKRYHAITNNPKQARKSIIKAIPNIPHRYPEATIILEKFKWDSNRMDEIIDKLTTYGSGTVVLNLPAGRHVFTMWINVSGPYSIQVLSNSCICVGTLEEMLTLMSRDSLLFREAYYNMVEKLQCVITSFGYNTFKRDLIEFYASFKPITEVSKKEWLEIQEVFHKVFFGTIEETIGPEALKVIKILLRKWQLKSSNLCDIYDTSLLCYPATEEEMKFVKIMQESARKIQSFFRGTYERLLMDHHRIQNKKHSRTLNALNGVGARFVHADKKLGAIVLRKFLRNLTIPDINQKYSWADTILNDICVAQFATNTKVSDSGSGWNFIGRYLFYVKTKYPLTIRINIFSNLSSYYIKVFDNDTSKEMKIIVNNVAVNQYPPNTNGYTTIAYGWAKGQAFINAKVIFACRQDNIDDLLEFNPHMPKKEILSDLYIPNGNNQLFKYILQLRSDLTILTLHLHTDYPKAKLKLRIYKQSDPDNIIMEKKNETFITVPSLALTKLAKIKSGTEIELASRGSVETDSDEKNCENYVIEAFVEDNSWPLNAKEWINVEREKDKKLLRPDLVKDWVGPEPKQASENEGPRWKMEVYSNQMDDIVFCKDTERDELLITQKELFFQSDQSKFMMCHELRESFMQCLIPNPDKIKDPEVRSFIREVFVNYVLPPFDTSEYEIGNKENRHLQTQEELWKHFYDILTQHLLDTIDIEVENRNKVIFFLNEEQKWSKLTEWFKDVRRESQFIMEQAYKTKFKYIERLYKTVYDQMKDNNSV